MKYMQLLFVVVFEAVSGSFRFSLGVCQLAWRLISLLNFRFQSFMTTANVNAGNGVTVCSKSFINFVIFIFEYIMNSNVNGAFKRINHSFVFWWRQM